MSDLVEEFRVQRGVLGRDPSVSYSQSLQVDLALRDLIFLMDAPADGGDVPAPIGLPEHEELVLPVLREKGEELDLVCNSIDILGTSHLS